MVAKSYFRGHPIECVDGEKWVYSDNKEAIPVNGGEVRPCKKCGKLFTLGKGEADPCLGVLPGVDNACCGHGIKSESYIRFTNGVVVREFIIDKKEKRQI